VAWKCKDDKSASAQADRALRNERVRELVALIDPAKSDMTLEEAFQLLAKHARTADKAADAIKCLQLIGEWRGWSKDVRVDSTAVAKEKSIYEQAEELDKVKL